MTRNGKITLTLVATAIMLVSSYNYAKLMTRTWCDYRSFCYLPHCRNPLHCRCTRCHDAGSNSLFPDLSLHDEPWEAEDFVAATH
jgi:hypothetical protein